MVSNLDSFDAEYEVESTKVGITGDVTPYTFTAKEYPYILLGDLSKVGSLAKLHSLRGLIRPVATGEVVKKLAESTNTRVPPYNIYTEMSGGMYLLGTISEERLEAIVDSVGIENIVEASINKDTTYTGSMIYALLPVRSRT